MKVFGFILLLGFVSTVSANDHHVFPRPLILDYPENINFGVHETEEAVRLRCSSWRFAVEANNLRSWKTIPVECGSYVRDYIMNSAYDLDLEIAAEEARVYARSVQLGGDGKDVWVFDVDETLLSNLPYYAEHGFGLEVFDGREFDKWVGKATAPAIKSSLKLYEEILELGFKAFLLTGRSEEQRSVTVDNLIKAGFQNWDKLILRGQEDQGKHAIIYKSEQRSAMVTEGYRIQGNSGDQWSDILGFSMCNRSFKLPNPMYHIV